MGIVVFDLDGTLIDGRTIFAIAERYGFLNEIVEVMERPIKNYIKSEIIAGFLKGLRISDLLEIIQKIHCIAHFVVKVSTK